MDFNKQKEYLQNRTYLLGIKDEELIIKIVEDQDYLGIIYEKFKDDYTRRFARLNKDMDYLLIDDIVTDSILILNEKILKAGVSLLEKKENKKKPNIAGYLYVICQNQIFTERKRSKKHFVHHYDEDNEDDDETFEINIPDEHNHIADPEELIFSRGIIDQKTNIMIQALKIMKNLGGKCYSLIMLSSSARYNYKMRNLTKLFNYSKEATTRNQKYKCIQRFKRIHSQLRLA